MIFMVMAGVILATGLTLFALRGNMTYFYTPSDIVGESAKNIKPGKTFRLGGLVVYGTLEKEGTIIRFVVTDNTHDLNVFYDGIPPNLFREGQGIIATGALDERNVFIASELLAKHDENYMPPEVAKALKEQQLYRAPAEQE